MVGILGMMRDMVDVIVLLRGVVGFPIVLVVTLVVLKGVVCEAVVGMVEVVVGDVELRVVWLSGSASLQPFSSGNNSSPSSHPH